MAFFASKRKLRPTDDEAAGELNTVPYLDILMNLILFMLLSISGLTAFGVVNATTEARGEAAVPTAPLLIVGVSPHGFAFNAATIPLLGDGRHDFAALTARLIDHKRAFPAHTQVVLKAQPDTPFEVLVSTMDAMRETPAHAALFPDVTLGTP